MIINLGMYLITFLYYYSRERITIMTFLWLFYTIFSAFSVYLCASGLYWRVVGSRLTEEDPISVIPYIMNYICVFLIILPLQKVKYKNIRFNELTYSKKILQFIQIMYIIEISYGILKVYQFIVALNYGLGNFHMLGPEGQNEIFYGGFSLLLVINYLGRFTTTIIMPFVMIYTAYIYTNFKIKKRLFITCLGLYGFDSCILGLTSGSRAMIFFAILNLIFFVILFAPKINTKLKRKIAVSGLALGALIIFFTSQITEQRFEDYSDMTPGESVYRYLGEAFPNLAYEYWDQIRFANGKRIFYDVYSFFSSDSAKGQDSWTDFTGARTYYFKTLYGDLYIDFGVFIPLLIVALMSLLIRLYLRQPKIGFQKIGFIYYYFSFCIASLFGFLNFTTMQDFMIITMLFLFSMAIKQYALKRKIPRLKAIT